MADAPVPCTGNSDQRGQDAPASRYALPPVKGCPTAYRSATLPLDRQPPTPFPRPCRGEQINKVSPFPRYSRLYGTGQLRSELRPEILFSFCSTAAGLSSGNRLLRQSRFSHRAKPETFLQNFKINVDFVRTLWYTKSVKRNTLYQRK